MAEAGRSVVGGWPAPATLDVTAALLGFDPPALRGAGRPGGTPRWLDVQGRPQPFDQALFGDRPVAELAARVVDDYPEFVPEAVDDALALGVGERRGREQVEAEFDPRGGPVGVLPAGPTRCAEEHLQLSPRDVHAASHHEHVGGIGHTTESTKTAAIGWPRHR